MRFRFSDFIGAWILVMMAAAACGSSVEKAPPELEDDSVVNDYDEVAKTAGDVGACMPDPNPPPSEHYSAEKDPNGGGCFIMAGPEGEYGNDPWEQTWVTTCKGTSCFCVENDVVVCACETEGLWCDEQVPSCCPKPFP